MVTVTLPLDVFEDNAAVCASDIADDCESVLYTVDTAVSSDAGTLLSALPAFAGAVLTCRGSPSVA